MKFRCKGNGGLEGWLVDQMAHSESVWEVADREASKCVLQKKESWLPVLAAAVATTAPGGEVMLHKLS